MTELTDRTEETMSPAKSDMVKKRRGRPSKDRTSTQNPEGGESPLIHVRKNKKGKEERKRDRSSKKKNADEHG